MSTFASQHLPFASGISTVQAATYLLFVCLFSISFLVFLNSSVSFVVTDLLGIKHGVGDIVGTLGFADELVALVACPIWGLLSDRIGVRWVCYLGYTIVGISLLLFVQAKNVYPQLLLARMLFSIGGAATATMVTAILPSMTSSSSKSIKRQDSAIERIRSEASQNRNSMTPSVDSQLTITPHNYYTTQVSQTRSGRSVAHVEQSQEASSSPSKLAGLVGSATGCGALLALAIFLPLPAQFSTINGITQGQAVADSFYVVAIIALVVAIFCFMGLKNLQGEEGKGWSVLLGKHQLQAQASGQMDSHAPFLPLYRLLLDATMLAFRDSRIGLGYLGGFVARASSVGITLFIPLYINAYFISHGFCHGHVNDPNPELKKECRAAYVLAAELTGASQLVALLAAPLFGYLSHRYQKYNLPLLFASVCGILGYIGLANLQSPEVKDVDGRGGSAIIFLIVALIGISQIGAIVCSLGLIGRGVQAAEINGTGQDGANEPLLGSAPQEHGTASRSHLKGSIAGVYSLSGGAAILLLTKLGGYLFDKVGAGMPFLLMASFNAILCIAGIGNALLAVWKTRQSAYQ